MPCWAAWTGPPRAACTPNNYEAIINSLASVMLETGPRPGTVRTAARTQSRSCSAWIRGPRRSDQAGGRTYDDQVRHGLLDEIAGLEARYDLGRQLRLHGRDSANQVLHTHGYREYFDLAHSGASP